MSQSRSRHKAIVTRNNDPELLGNIWVHCQTLAAFGVELPFPIRPADVQFSTKGASNGTGFGALFFIPEVGTEVEIEVLDGTDDDDTFGEAFLLSPDAVYFATTPSQGLDLPIEFKTNYPKRGGIKTAAGHLILFDNTDGKEMIQIVANFGKANKQTLVTLTKDNILFDNINAVLTMTMKQINLGKPSPDAVVKGTTYRNAEHTLFNTLQSQMTSLATAMTALATAMTSQAAASTGTLSALAAGFTAAATAATSAATAATAMATALTTMEASASTYLSTITNTG